jgi:hypothetical protein
MADINQLIDSLSQLTVVEAADLVKKLEDKWGVKAASGGGMMMAAPAAAAAAPVAEKTEFTVVLMDSGSNKIKPSSRRSARSPASASRRPRTWSTALRRTSRKTSRRTRLPR